MALTWPYAGLHDEAGNLLIPLTVDPDTDPMLVHSIDLGSLDVDDDIEADQTGSGVVDRTQFTRASAVVIELTALGNAEAGPHAWLQRLRGWCHPARRPYLHVQAVEWDAPRRIQLRGAAAPRDLTDLQPEAQFQWKAPQGYLEDVDASEAVVLAATTGPPGLSFPLSFPISFPPTNPFGSRPIEVGGDADAWWEIDIYGPVIGPALHHGTDWAVVFRPDFQISEGHFVRIQPRGRFGPEVLGDGDPEQDVYGRLDFGATSWQPLTDGANQLTLTAAGSGAGFRAVIRWRNRWL